MRGGRAPPRSPRRGPLASLTASLSSAVRSGTPGVCADSAAAFRITDDGTLALVSPAGAVPQCVAAVPAEGCEGTTAFVLGDCAEAVIFRDGLGNDSVPVHPGVNTLQTSAGVSPSVGTACGTAGALHSGPQQLQSYWVLDPAHPAPAWVLAPDIATTTRVVLGDGTQWADDAACGTRVLAMDGSPSSVARAPDLRLPLSTFSVSMWFKMTDLLHRDMNLFSYGAWELRPTVFCQIRSGGVMDFHCRWLAAGAAGAYGPAYNSRRLPLSREEHVNQWLHFVCVKDEAGGVLRYYLNGDLVATHAYSGALEPQDDDVAFQLGWLENDCCAQKHFLGAISDVRVFDVALTGVDALSMYGHGCSAVANYSGMVRPDPRVPRWLEGNPDWTSDTVADRAYHSECFFESYSDSCCCYRGVNTYGPSSSVDDDAQTHAALSGDSGYIVYDLGSCHVLQQFRVRDDGDIANPQDVSFQVADAVTGPWTDAVRFFVGLDGGFTDSDAVRAAGRFVKLVVHQNHGFIHGTRIVDVGFFGYEGCVYADLRCVPAVPTFARVHDGAVSVCVCVPRKHGRWRARMHSC